MTSCWFLLYLYRAWQEAHGVNLLPGFFWWLSPRARSKPRTKIKRERQLFQSESTHLYDVRRRTRLLALVLARPYATLGRQGCRQRPGANDDGDDLSIISDYTAESRDEPTDRMYATSDDDDSSMEAKTAEAQWNEFCDTLTEMQKEKLDSFLTAIMMPDPGVEIQY